MIWILDAYREILQKDQFLHIKVACFIVLSCFEVYKDIRSHEVHSLLLLLYTILFLVIDFFTDRSLFFMAVSGVLASIVIYILIFFISHGGVGLGDLFYHMWCAALFGIYGGIFIFFIAHWLALAFVIPFLLFRKIQMKTEIPMIPFHCGASALLYFLLTMYRFV